jgi:hypothetical protein
MIVGGGIYWFGATKACLQCALRIQHNAVECKHCGAAQENAAGGRREL